VDGRMDTHSQFANASKNVRDVLWRSADILAEGCCDNGLKLPLIVQEHLGGRPLLFCVYGLFELLR